MNNDVIKQGAYYLLRGGTLLSEPCKKCGNLQIKFKGNILCMTCQHEAESNITEKLVQPVTNVQVKETIETEMRDPQNPENDIILELQPLLHEIERGVMRNMGVASKKLSNKLDLIEYQNIANIIEQSLRILKYINEIKLK